MKNTKIKTMVRLAIFSAIIIIMAFTPLGYLRIGIVSITFIPIPVAIGAILTGVGGGAFLGTVFGLTSFAQCFGMDAFGTALFGINPIFAFIMCVVTRTLAGTLCAVVYKVLKKRFASKQDNISQYVPDVVSSLSAAFFNTLFFVSALVLLFGNTQYIKENLGDTVLKVIAALVTFNSAIELVVCGVVGAALSKALSSVIHKRIR